MARNTVSTTPLSRPRAAFRVGRDFEGQATTSILVQIPDDIRGTKPMANADLTLSNIKPHLAKPYDSHGKAITDDVLKVTWKANGRDNALSDAWYGEFVLSGGTPKQPGPLWFKVLHSCDKGQNNWSEIPASGTSTNGMKERAMLLQVCEVGGTSFDH